MAQRNPGGGALVAAPARRPQEAVLREVLLQRDGWEAATGEVIKVRVRRRHYLVKPLARGEGWCVYHCEAPRHAELPGYAERRELHRRAAVSAGRPLTVFTDAAGTRSVWSWTRQRPFGVAAYTEEYRNAGDPEAEAIAMPVPEGEREPADPELARAGADAALEILIGRLRRSPLLRRLLGNDPALSAAERLQRLVEGSRTPEVPRRVWAELGALRILDSACGTGGWLEGCLLGLSSVASACLRRMQPWVEDPVPPRADRHADFRRLVVRSRELGRGSGQDRLAVELVLLRCLRGVESDAVSATRCRRALAAHLTAAGVTADEEALVDVRWGSLSTEVRSAEELAERARREPEVAAVAAAVGGEAEALARAEEQLIRMRLRGAISEGDLAEGRHEIQRRRRRISRLLGDRKDGDQGPPLLLPWIEYYAMGPAGGFHLIRGQHPPPPGSAADGLAG